MPLIVVKLDPASDIAGHIVLASQIYVSTFCQFYHLVKNIFSYKVMMIKTCVTKYWIALRKFSVLGPVLTILSNQKLTKTVTQGILNRPS